MRPELTKVELMAIRKKTIIGIPGQLVFLVLCFVLAGISKWYAHTLSQNHVLARIPIIWKESLRRNGAPPIMVIHNTGYELLVGSQDKILQVEKKQI